MPAKIEGTAELLARCSGKEFKVPWLLSLCTGWTPSVSPFERHLDSSTQAWCDKWITNPESHRRTEKSSPWSFARFLVPGAKDVGDVVLLAIYGAWVLPWDGCVDFGEFNHKSQTLQTYKSETLDAIQHGMLSEGGLEMDELKVAPTYISARSTFDLAKMVRQRTKSVSLRRYIYDTFRKLRLGSIKAQTHFERGTIFSIDEYWGMRMKFSGVDVTLAFILSTYDVDSLGWFFAHELVTEAVRLINMIISATNDIGKTIDYFLDGCRNSATACIQWYYDSTRYFNYDTSWGEVDVTITID